jgi:glucose/arabinose dehydrogenase
VNCCAFLGSLLIKAPFIFRRMKSVRKLAVMFCLGATFALQGAEPVSLKLVADGLVSPMTLASIPDGSGNKVIVDQVGTAHVLTKAGKLEEELFLDLRPKLTKLRDGFDERGFLSLAFHPKFKENRKFYVFYSAPRRAEAPEDWDCTSHLSEFVVDAKNPIKADAWSERIVLQIDKPSFNHNGGRIAFGPDGFLYIGVGDGGDGNDRGKGHGPKGNGQDKNNILGKILRIDVDSKQPYGIPQDNPFAQGGGRPEVFAYGIRNPWGISFDRGGKHELFAADVGQSMFEEINIIVKGGNYGWNMREGLIGFNPDNPIKPPETASAKAEDGSAFVDPIVAYKNMKGNPGGDGLKGTSVTGGYVYRGKSVPALDGKYIFADWTKNWGVGDGILFVATRPAKGKGQWELEALPVDNLPKGRLGGYVTAFGEDADGEVYVLVNGRNGLTGKTGKVYQIAPASGGE